MQSSLVMTVIAADRPGLVDVISGVITEYEGNWLESRMSRLGGQFAGILRVEMPAGREEGFIKALQALEAQGMNLVVHKDPSHDWVGGEAHQLEVVGHDRPGIVRQIAHALVGHGVNVEEFSSEVVSAPMSGEPLFKACAKVRLPEGCDLTELRLELEKIAADLIVELSFVKAAQALSV